MTTEGPPTILKIFKDKARLVREIARNMDLAYTESDVVGEPDLVRFKFDIDFANAQTFLSALPIEAFAHRAVIGGPGKS